MKQLKAFVGFALTVATVTTSALCARAQNSSTVVKLDAALNAIVPADAQLEKLADGFEFLEGPVWVRSGGYLLFSNMAERAIDKWTPNGKISVFLDMSKYPGIENPKEYVTNGTTLDRQGRIVFCSQAARAILRAEPDGKFTVLADRYEGKRLNRPNDLVYKSDGALYFTDDGAATNQALELPNAVYMLKNGKPSVVTTQFTGPNGLAFSPNEKFLYVNETRTKLVWRWSVTPDDMLADGRLFIDMSSDPGNGGPDGMKVDEKGNVYCSGPRGLWILSPEGKHLGTILTPDKVSNLTFGDADGKTLYITLHNALYRIRLNIPGIRP